MKDILGAEVTIVMADATEKHGFVAFCDDEKGLAIKDTETQENILCHDIKKWDAQRKTARRCGLKLLYRCNGQYAHRYLKACIKTGLIHSAFVDNDIRNSKATACGITAVCPSGL